MNHLRLSAFICGLFFCLAVTSFAQEDDRNIRWDGSYLPKVVPGATFGTLRQATPVVGSPVKPVTSANSYGGDLVQGAPASAVT
ncbi:MAG: hypothetical protein RID07_08490, partial [Lacipirellulaceae bacterium]